MGIPLMHDSPGSSPDPVEGFTAYNPYLDQPSSFEAEKTSTSRLSHIESSFTCVTRSLVFSLASCPGTQWRRPKTISEHSCKRTYKQTNKQQISGPHQFHILGSWVVRVVDPQGSYCLGDPQRHPLKYRKTSTQISVASTGDTTEQCKERNQDTSTGVNARLPVGIFIHVFGCSLSSHLGRIWSDWQGLDSK